MTEKAYEETVHIIKMTVKKRLFLLCMDKYILFYIFA